MYRGLIGPYPYGKFALVENFWETGYGMPSFTLLGPQIIRFPFILSSSYPHEILHNWWGNSVFVDYETGNWCEGLTAYMADHLIQEQRGKGDEYRRDTLQKYRDYVRDGRDFPLTEFRSRHSAATEAVGLREDADGLPHAAPAARRRGVPQVGGALLPRVPRAGRPRSPTCASRWRPSPAQDLGALLRRRTSSGRARRGSRRRSPTCATRRADGYDVAFVLEQTQDGRAARARRAGGRADARASR